jgi:hypothetical protein
MYCVSCEVRTEFLYVMLKKVDRLCVLVVRVPGYRSRGPGSIPCATRFSEKLWVWNGVHSASWVQLRRYLGAAVWKAEITAVGIRHADHATPIYPQKLTLISSTSCGRSVGIIRSRTKATELPCLNYLWYLLIKQHAMRTYGLVALPILTSALDGEELSVSPSCHFTAW